MAFPQIAIPAAVALDPTGLPDGAIPSDLAETYGFGGSAGGLTISGGKLVGTGSRVLKVNVPADSEIVFEIAAIGAASAPIGFFVALGDADQSGWHSLFLYYTENVGWVLYSRPPGGGNTIIDSASTPLAEAPALAAGDMIGWHHVDDVVKIRHYDGATWNQTPIVEATGVTTNQVTGPIALEGSSSWAIGRIFAGAAVAEDGGEDPDPDPDPDELGPDTQVTLYVDADHDDASNSWTRAEAMDNPDKPFLEVQAAAVVARAGDDDENDPGQRWADIVRFWPSTLNKADPTSTKDKNVYPGVHHLRNLDGSDVLPHAINDTGAPIRVVGEIVGAVRPKILKFDFRLAEGWQLEDCQRGYDRGSGNDHGTAGDLVDCKDMTFVNVKSTGGGYYTIAGRGVLRWERCITYSPWGGTGGFMDGAGFKHIALNTTTGLEQEVHIEHDLSHFEDIRGEDAMQVALGEVEVGATYTLFRSTLKDILQGTAPGAPHTDGIQALGGYRHTIIGNRFINVDSPYLGSDGRTGRVAIIGNLVDGNGNGFHGQGMESCVIAHNTIKVPGIAIAIGDRFNTLTDHEDFVQRLTIVNNFAGDLAFAAAVVIDPDSVVAGNSFYRQPGLVTPWGTNLSGLPEWGVSDRLAEAGLTGAYELATSPAPSAGIGQGIDIEALLDDDLFEYVENDLLGRPYADPRDVGAFQSDPSDDVTPAPRPPYLRDRTPTPGQTNVRAGATLGFRLVPVPGKTINAGTVNADTIKLTVPGGAAAPLDITLGSLDEDGGQDVTVTPGGRLRELVLYTVTVDGIEDTEGSEIDPVSWPFRGPNATAVREGTVLGSFDGNIGALT